MALFTATVQTEHASRYLQQLCKHWSHRFTVTFDPAHGVVHMTGATCTFDAEQSQLLIKLDGDDAAQTERLRGVVAEHLQRFAFREPLEIAWA